MKSGAGTQSNDIQRPTSPHKELAAPSQTLSLLREVDPNAHHQAIEKNGQQATQGSHNCHMDGHPRAIHPRGHP